MHDLGLHVLCRTLGFVSSDSKSTHQNAFWSPCIIFTNYYLLMQNKPKPTAVANPLGNITLKIIRSWWSKPQELASFQFTAACCMEVISCFTLTWNNSPGNFVSINSPSTWPNASAFCSWNAWSLYKCPNHPNTNMILLKS